jgi:urease accessory protein
MDGLGAFGTLILYGPIFASLAAFFMDEFKSIPRIGGRKWDNSNEADDAIRDLDPLMIRRKARQKQEASDGLLWSAALTRGCVVVKFGAREVEGGKRWLRSMLETEGSVIAQFGERCLLCLR